MQTFVRSSVNSCRKNNDNKTVIVLSHFPLFSAKNEGASEISDPVQIRDWTKCYDQLRVDLVIAGHNHVYLRYEDEGYDWAGFKELKPSYTTHFITSTFSGPFDKEGRKKIIKSGRNNSGNVEDFQQTALFKQNGNGLIFAGVPTYSFLEIKEQKIFVTSKESSKGKNY